VVSRVNLRAEKLAPAVASDDRDRPCAHIRIEDDVSLLRYRENYARNQILGELTRMDGLLLVIVLDVSKDPDVAGVLSIGMRREFPSCITTI
jgi:hypothetical protein